MNNLEDLSSEEVTQKLTYIGFILIAFELVKSLIISPIRRFYHNTTFSDNPYFHSYEQDVLLRHKNEFEACLLYLRDFMKAIDEEDFKAIQELREHRNMFAHNIVKELVNINLADYSPLFEKIKKALFKLSRHQTFIEIGADPEFKDIDWNTLKGPEYILFEEIVDKIKYFVNLSNPDKLSQTIDLNVSDNIISSDTNKKFKTEYPPQRCSYCKGLIFHPNDRKKERVEGECKCDERGEYYIKSNLRSNYHGTQKFLDDDNYPYTKNDQEHYF